MYNFASGLNNTKTLVVLFSFRNLLSYTACTIEHIWIQYLTKPLTDTKSMINAICMRYA